VASAQFLCAVTRATLLEFWRKLTLWGATEIPAKRQRDDLEALSARRPSPIQLSVVGGDVERRLDLGWL
jgi:hypothetical protein